MDCRTLVPYYYMEKGGTIFFFSFHISCLYATRWVLTDALLGRTISPDTQLRDQHFLVKYIMISEISKPCEKLRSFL